MHAYFVDAAASPAARASSYRLAADAHLIQASVLARDRGRGRARARALGARRLVARYVAAARRAATTNVLVVRVRGGARDHRGRAAVAPRRRAGQHAAAVGTRAARRSSLIGLVGGRAAARASTSTRRRGLLFLLVIGMYIVLFARRVPAAQGPDVLPLLRPLPLQRSAPGRAGARRDRSARAGRRVHPARPLVANAASIAGRIAIAGGARGRRGRPRSRRSTRPAAPRSTGCSATRTPRCRASTGSPRGRRRRARSSTRDPRPGPYRWFYSNTYRAFALPLEQSFDREVFGIPPEASGATPCTTRPKRGSCCSAHKLDSGVPRGAPDARSAAPPRRRAHAVTSGPSGTCARPSARRKHGAATPWTFADAQVRRLRDHVDVLVACARWRRSRSSARAARCSPATCSATSSATRSSPESEITLFDIDAERLDTSELVARRVADALGSPAKITHDHRSARRARRRRLRDQHDPGRRLRAVHRHRLRGAEALRSAPDDRRHARDRRDHARAAHDSRCCSTICADMEELCPDVWFLNYTNPMAINCRAISRASSIRTVGLCHSVQGTAFELSHRPRHPVPGDRLPRGRHQPHGVLPALRARRRRPLPAAARAWPSRARCPTATACATRC